MCRPARLRGAKCGSAAAVGDDGFTRSSITALEGGLVAEATRSDAEEYLHPIKVAGRAPTPWLEAIASQVPKLRDWWRCVAASLSGTSEKGTATRREGLSIMLEAAVMSSSVEEQAHAVDHLLSWTRDWNSREGHLRKAMHE